ncbi:glycoside hydrolase family 35 protein [Zasmidium cellare ATCC 36951]|uniref:Glycoside hydrolase family 35 protein n=1 Tax=Zasmidium cellare ATCC 36951 TaxID=1080233 RepID=A0A6A6CB29_ZASCE|nr:glycoside hydrolase family 35 protein [Zasmidium cellare ATCC 36951]KAF2164407.1 glycoside hydrolase family 35 protein [Zasmidium cellare ATCC 36951]
MPPQIPHLRSTELSKQLIINDEPFLMLAGELQNSSFTSSSFMKEVWPKLKAANLNTVLGCITWEQFEPEEGDFHLDELEKLIQDAKSLGMKLILLWFGSFKNGLSTYVPPWVKMDPKRFPRAKIRTATTEAQAADVLSIFGQNAQKADSLAFKTLMQHIKRIDEDHSTVIMVQVENEVGLLGDSRDRGELAEQQFKQTIPTDLLDVLEKDWSRLNQPLKHTLTAWREEGFRRGLTWASFPGSRVYVDELFMAYHYALYVNAVASAGKDVYPLPMYTNVWQNYGSEDRDKSLVLPAKIDAAGGNLPGAYPSGGAIDNVLDVWQTFAPALDFIAPDVYLNDYENSCRKYRHRGQPLLIPEQRRDDHGARRIWAAFCSYQALGAAPFGIDTLSVEENVFRKHYELLSSVAPHILQAQTKTSASYGFFFDELLEDGTDTFPTREIDMAGWHLAVERSFVFGKPSAGSGAVIHLHGSEFLLLGWGFQVSFTSLDERAYFNGLLKFEEKEVVNNATGELRTLRRLNGDETRSGKCAVMPSEDPDYGGFPISITIPARTGIAVCEPYALFAET